MSKAKRFAKFSNTWIWFFNAHITKNKIGVIKSLSYGAAARILFLFAFIATIKSVMWIKNPYSIPKILTEQLPTTESSIVLMLAIAPGIIFCIAAFSRNQYNKHLHNLQHKIARNATIGIVHIPTTAEKMDARVRGYSHQDIRKTYNTVLLIVSKLVNIFILTTVAGAVTSACLFISWEIVVSMLTIGVISSLIFLATQHKRDSHQKINYDGEKLIQDDMVKKIGATRKEDSSVEASNAKNSIEEYLSKYSVSRSTEKTSEYKSTFFLDLGQSVIIVSFLAVVSIYRHSTLDLFHLAVLALAFRFTLGYAQAIVRDMGKLLSIHQDLVRIQKKTQH